jgi:hypothetical protein
MSGGKDYVLGSVTLAPAHAPAIIDAMAESIVDLLMRLAEVEQERDFYKAAASKLMKTKPHNGRRKK